MFEQVVAGATTDEIEDVEVVRRPALHTTVNDVLEADGYLLGTPANLGYMSGGLKHFFDSIYYPCLDATAGRPYACYVHGNEGTEGALNGIKSITTGLSWKQVAEPLAVSGQPDATALSSCWELGAAVAAGLMP